MELFYLLNYYRLKKQSKYIFNHYLKTDYEKIIKNYLILKENNLFESKNQIDINRLLIKIGWSNNNRVIDYISKDLNKRINYDVRINNNSSLDYIINSLYKPLLIDIILSIFLFIINIVNKYRYEIRRKDLYFGNDKISFLTYDRYTKEEDEIYLFFHPTIIGGNILISKFLDRLNLELGKKIVAIQYLDYNNIKLGINNFNLFYINYYLDRYYCNKKVSIIAHSAGCFYGLALVKSFIRKYNRLILIEGFVNVVNFDKNMYNGIHNVPKNIISLLSTFDFNCKLYKIKYLNNCEKSILFEKPNNCKELIMIFSKEDEYIELNKELFRKIYKFDYYIINGRHGDFLLNENIQNEIFKIINIGK